MKRYVPLAAVVALVAAAVGCSSASSDELAGSPPAESAVEFFSDVGGPEAAYLTWQGLVQEEIAACMRLDGFEYVAEPPTNTAPQDLASQTLDDDEWAAEFGYGLVSAAIVFAEDPPAPDPNAALINSLSASEREGYFTALLGPRGDAIPPLEERGCTGAAVLASGGEAVTESFDQFALERQERLSRLNSLPEMVDASELWSDCMQAEGYLVSNHAEAVASIELRIIDATADITALLASLDESARSDLISSGLSNLANYPQAELDRIQVDEIAMATADLACFEKHVAPVRGPLAIDVESDLVMEYGDDLRVIRDIVSE